MKLTIVIPAVSHFFSELQCCIYSLRSLVPPNTVVYIFDNGLNNHQIKIVEERFNFVSIIIIEQKLNKLDRISYRFKSMAFDYLIKNNILIDGVLLYLDTKTHLKYNYKQLENILKIRPVWGGDAYGTEKDWTNIKAIEKIGFDNMNLVSNTPHIQAWAMLIDYNTLIGKKVISDYIRYCSDDEIIYPKDTYKGFNVEDSNNHRQDQSVWSLTLKKNNIEYNNWVQYVTEHNTMHL